MYMTFMFRVMLFMVLVVVLIILSRANKPHMQKKNPIIMNFLLQREIHDMKIYCYIKII